MIALNSDQATLPNFNHAIEELRTWRNRYSKKEYPDKLLINTFYRQHTVNFMWDILYRPFKKSLFGNRTTFNDYVSAREHISQIYNQTKLNKTQPTLMNLLQKRNDVGGLIYNNMSKLVSDASNKSVEELEFTYVYYAIANEFLFRWSAVGMMGKNKYDSFMAVTGIGVNTDSMNDYDSSVNLLGQLGASQFLSRYYKPLPDFY